MTEEVHGFNGWVPVQGFTYSLESVGLVTDYAMKKLKTGEVLKLNALIAGTNLNSKNNRNHLKKKKRERRETMPTCGVKK